MTRAVLGTAREVMKLRWEPFHSGEIAMLGNVNIGMVVPLAADPGTYAFSVRGIYASRIKLNGHVKGKTSAKRAVNRAFAQWAENAGIAT